MKQKKKNELITFFKQLPKQPSHYVRKRTKKLYLEEYFKSKADLYKLYVQQKEETPDKSKPLSMTSFSAIFYEMNLGIFSPKKDQCDTCLEFKNNNIDEKIWKTHDENKKKAREEHDRDKNKALNDECILLCMDMQAVKMSPSLHATKIYFRTKLACHNFTIYDCASHQCTCYWFTEVDCNLTASTFVSCITYYLERHCLVRNLPVIIYSDGCTFQNRNVILANALLHFSVKHKISITQKYLTKGHTQMECDSVHSCIERKLKNRTIELPADYIKATKEARTKPEPYEVIQLSYEFFKDYSKTEFHKYSTIRPKKEVTVTDIKALQYATSGVISYKIDFNAAKFEELNVRVKDIDFAKVEYAAMYECPQPISYLKYKHLQELKSVISKDCHSFYNLLSFTIEKKKSKKQTSLQNEIEEEVDEPKAKKTRLASKEKEKGSKENKETKEKKKTKTKRK